MAGTQNSQPLTKHITHTRNFSGERAKRGQLLLLWCDTMCHLLGMQHTSGDWGND